MPPQAVQKPAPRSSFLLPFAAGLAVGGLALLIYVAVGTKNPIRASVGSEGASDQRPSLGVLGTMTADELSKQDLALLNLRCAEGLPGAEDLDIDRTLATLDQWAARVRSETNRNLYKFRQQLTEEGETEAHYRMGLLVTVLQQDFGVKYNPERIEEPDFTQSKDLFIHGMVDCDNGGTCVSMPVLYTAIARRLEYPVYLVSAKEHVLCRWDGEGERFNIEATNQGMNTFGDDHYMEWPRKITKAEVDRGLYLKSLSNAEAFSMFLASRGHCWQDNKNLPEASVAYALAAKHSPKHPVYEYFLTRLVGSQARRPQLTDTIQMMRSQRRPYPTDSFGRLVQPMPSALNRQAAFPGQFPNNSFQSRSPNPQAGFGFQP